MWIGQRDDAFEVLAIVPGGPAAAAGLKKGDVILAIDGRETRFLSLPAERLALYYDGRPRTLKLTLKAEPRDRVATLVMRPMV